MVTRDPLPPAVGAALDDILRETLGSGARPAAIYLLKQAPGIEIDIFDRLPTPFGLVHGGGAFGCFAHSLVVSFIK